MSNQWVVSIRSKKSKRLEQKLSQNDRKKIIENAPKLEEILPSHQVKTLFSSDKKGKSKENKSLNSKPSTPKKVAKPANEAPKKQQQIQPAKPKNLEAALSSLSAMDLENLVAGLKAGYSDNQQFWLREISTFLNSNLHYDADPLFSGKSYQYPSILMPKDIKAIIQKTFKEVDEANVFYFYDQLLDSLATEMSKNRPYLGYKILLQIIAQDWPQVCSSNLARSAILRNSYQNRSQIGLSILWALGQGGYYDLTTGIKVWQNIMIPIIEMKSYTKFICEYIEKILKTSKNNSKINLTQDEFFASYNVLMSKSSNSLPKDCQKSLAESASLLLDKYIQSSTKVSNLFLILYKSIESNGKNDIEISGCMKCLLKSDDCFKIWKMNYKKNTLPALKLLTHISKKFQFYPESFTKSETFKQFAKDIIAINKELLGSKKIPDEIEAIMDIVKNVQEKSSQKKSSTTKQSSCCCTWFFGTILLIGAIGGLIGYDTHIHGGVFEKSATGKFLKDIGALPYVEVGWYKTMSTSARGYKWAEQNAPIYYEKVCIFSKPYVDLGKDLAKIGCNTFCNFWEATKDLVNSKTPVVVEFVEQYVPGLPKKVQDLSESAWSTSVSVYHSGCDFFKTKVFVGSLSPESLSKALNQTTIAAAKYYSWFHEKVDAYAKIK